MFKFNIQLFANEIKTTDVAPGISVDFASRIASNIAELRRILGITAPKPMSVGTAINMYAMSRVNTPTQVAEGVTIPLTEIKRQLVDTIQLPLDKYREQTTAEAIQKVGRRAAINDTDDFLVKLIRKDVKSRFFSTLATGTGSATAQNPGIQGAMADTWAELAVQFEDEDVTPVYFASQADVAKYLGKADITMQTVFGWNYIENFLGLGTAILTSQITAGTFLATAKENIVMYYLTMNGDISGAFGLTTDELGYIGIKSGYQNEERAQIESLVMDGIKFFVEYAGGVVKGTITAS